MKFTLQKAHCRPLMYTLMLLLVCYSFNATAQNRSFDILEGQDKIEIPFSFSHNFIIVEVQLFGILPMKFIFDTGAENTILFTRQFTDFMNVDYDLRIPIIGSDLSNQLYALVARSIDFELVGLPSQKRDILVLEEHLFNLSELTGIQIHGLLGGSFFKNTVIEIDYKRRKLIFHNPRTYELPKRGFRKVKVEMLENKPYIHAQSTLQNGPTLNLRLLVDTGAGLALLLHNNTHESLTLPEEFIHGKLGVGLGGMIEGFVGRTDLLIIDDISFKNVLTSFQDISGASISETAQVRNGLIGNQLLLRFHIIIDYVRNEMYIKPKMRRNRKFNMDKSGLIIIATGPLLNEYKVFGTINNSPAALAGIEEGDTIKKINGYQSSILTLEQVNKVLQKRSGKKIKVILIRDGERIKRSFNLKELI